MELTQCQICHENREETQPQMTLMCNHVIHTRCYFLHNLYRCSICQELIITNDMRDEIENNYAHDTDLTVKREKIYNLFKNNKVFKKRITDHKKNLSQLNKFLKNIKFESESVKETSMLKTYWKMYITEKKRVNSELKKLKTVKLYQKLFSKIKTDTREIENTYQIDLQKYARDRHIENNVKGIYFSAWRFRTESIFSKMIRKMAH